MLLTRFGQDRFNFETEIVGLGHLPTPTELKTRNSLIGKYFNTRINERVTKLGDSTSEFLPVSASALDMVYVIGYDPLIYVLSNVTTDRKEDLAP